MVQGLSLRMARRGRPSRVARGVAWGLIWLLLVAGASADPARTPAQPSPPGKIEFVGKNLFANTNGTFHKWRLVESQIDLADLERSHALVEVALASVDTANRRRDDHLRSEDFFEVERFPTATVRVHSPRPAGMSEGGHPLYSARFDLDLHGVRSTLDGEIELVADDPPAFEGRLTIDRTAFGIGPDPSRWNPLSISREISVRFRLEL